MHNSEAWKALSAPQGSEEQRPGTGTATPKEKSQRRVFNLILIMVSNGRPTCKERHAAELIVAMRDDLHSKAEYIAADFSIARLFPLQSCGGPYILRSET
jgi:hypothetical protein